MLRGTRIQNAAPFNEVVAICRNVAKEFGFEELIIPSIWEQATFVEKAGEEILDQMYAFGDKAGRPICLIPEVTAVIQQEWREHWCKEKKRPYKICYLSRCYRYERPQEGRYREFWQFGFEILGSSDNDMSSPFIKTVLLSLLEKIGIKYEFKDSVKRGLSYYVGNGFEAVCEELGAQKQIAGGGSYNEGCGFALGLDRVLLAMEK